MLPTFEDISRYIRNRRRQLGWSQKRLARTCGVSQSLITKLETQKTTPSYRSIQTIDAVLEEALRKSEERVGAIADREIVAVGADEPVSEACKILVKHDFSQIPVEKDGQYVGSVSSNSLMKVPSSRAIEAIMEPVFDIVLSTTPISDVARLLSSPSKKAVLVRDRCSGEVTGIVTPHDLLGRGG